MDELMDKINLAKEVIITAAMGDRIISTTVFKRPLVTGFDSYFEVGDEVGNEIIFEKNYDSVTIDDEEDFIVRYGVIDYYITSI